MRFVVALLLALAAAVPAAAAELVDPAPIAVPQGLTPELVAKAVKLAIVEQGWGIEGEGPGAMVARLTVRHHVARLDIAYDATSVRPRYKDSVNLDYEEHDGRREIHRSYRKWTEPLFTSIVKFLSRPDLAAYAAPDAAVKPAALAQIATNPPPQEKFAAFGRFEVLPLASAPEVAARANENALKKIQENLDIGVGALAAQWNATPKGDPQRILRIEPVVEQIRFIGVGARIFVGGMAGSSSVTLRVRFTDVASGAVIAEPTFYRVAGGNSLGVADNLMLTSVADLARDYVRDNYDEAVGGAVGDMRRR